MPLLSAAELAARDEWLADLLDSFHAEAPKVLRDGHLPNRCGPIAFAVAVYLRANSLNSGLIHVTGQPFGFAPGTGHYMATAHGIVVDFAFRQFDPTAPVPLLYDRADLDPTTEATSVGPAQTVGRAWHPWTAISGELEGDDPLYPDFVEYATNTDPLAYLVPGTGDPQWTTPYDDR